MEQEKKVQIIKFCIAILILVIIILSAVTVIIKYEVEGEKNMPFKLSKMIVISTAEGRETKNTNKKWALDVFQNNDIYLYIDKNSEYKSDKETYISSVEIENIKITNPKTGEIKAYMPNSLEGRLYDFSDNFVINENLVYKGGNRSNSKTLEIGNQGGEILIRFSNTSVGNYESDKDEQIIHDGSLITKAGKTIDDIKFSVTFDLIIKTNKNKYKTEITIDLPYEDIIKNGRTSMEETNMEKYIFKRVK